MKTLFIPCTVDGLDANSGSAMIRARWVAKYWEGAEVYDGTQGLRGWDLVVFQKAYLSDLARGLIHKLSSLRATEKKPLIAFDLCDPDFLEPGHRKRILDALPVFDFAVSPTQPLADWLGQYLPAYVIADRLDPDAFEGNRRAIFDNENPLLGWIGYKGNMSALLAGDMGGVIQRMELNAEIVGVDRPKPFEDWIADVVGFDILLNPRPNVSQYRYKSENKTIIGWALGVPVAETVGELLTLIDPKKRHQIIDTWTKIDILKVYHVEKSVTDWLQVYEIERAQMSERRVNAE